MSWLKPVTLSGRSVVLEPLSHSHSEDISQFLQEWKLWELWYTKIPRPEELEKEIDRRLDLQAKGMMLPFAVLNPKTGKAAGMTTYMNVDADNKRVEIGSTWYSPSVQRTGLNTEAKLLLLTHAFEELKCIAVEFRTSSFNFQSRKAIERLGAKLDGVLRSHSLHTNGTLRDTYVYSIIAAEWAAVKAHLTYLTQKYQ